MTGSRTARALAAIEESVVGMIARWDPHLHPRGRAGMFRDAPTGKSNPPARVANLGVIDVAAMPHGHAQFFSTLTREDEARYRASQRAFLERKAGRGKENFAPAEIERPPGQARLFDPVLLNDVLVGKLPAKAALVRRGKANPPAGDALEKAREAALAASTEAGVDPALAFAPADASPLHPLRSEYRMRAAAAILGAHAEAPDAVLLLPDEAAGRKARVALIATGDVARAQHEYRDTPLADLEVLSGIHVSGQPVFGQANANLVTRKVTMGSSSAMGDFRHELGHTLRAALSGRQAPMGHTPMTDFVAKRHAEALARVKAHIAAGKPKPKNHLEWEQAVGVGGKRGLDSWEEDFAEQYRGYHKAVFQTRHPEDKEHDAGALNAYRQRHPDWARFWDSWYTAQLVGRPAATGKANRAAGGEEELVSRLVAWDKDTGRRRRGSEGPQGAPAFASGARVRAHGDGSYVALDHPGTVEAYRWAPLHAQYEYRVRLDAPPPGWKVPRGFGPQGVWQLESDLERLPAGRR